MRSSIRGNEKSMAFAVAVLARAAKIVVSG